MSKINQIHIRAVMLCMLKMGKEHTHTSLLITFLIFNWFSISKKFWEAKTQSFSTIPLNTVYIKACQSVKDRSNTHKGCNAMYVEDGKRTYTHIFAHNFLNIQPIFNLQKFWEAETHSFSTIPSNTVYMKACQRCRR